MTPHASISLVHGIQQGSLASLTAGAGRDAPTALASGASASPHMISMYRIVACSSSHLVA
jgi:hypothetical protein